MRRWVLFLVVVGLSQPAVAHARKATTIKADCKARKLGTDMSVTACYRATPVAQLTIEVRGRPTPITLTRTINPEGTFDEKVRLDGHSDDYLGLSYDDSECAVAVLVRRSDGKVVADSGCKNSRYCAFTKMPKPGECAATLRCGDGGGSKPAPEEVAICP